jgi:hypothetical protein
MVVVEPAIGLRVPGLLTSDASRKVHWGRLRLLETVPVKTTEEPAGMDVGRGEMEAER